MAENHDEHEGPIHQAPWVPIVTAGICFGVTALAITVKYFFGAPAF